MHENTYVGRLGEDTLSVLDPVTALRDAKFNVSSHPASKFSTKASLSSSRSVSRLECRLDDSDMRELAAAARLELDSAAFILID